MGTSAGGAPTERTGKQKAGRIVALIAAAIGGGILTFVVGVATNVVSPVAASWLQGDAPAPSASRPAECLGEWEEVTAGNSSVDLLVSPTGERCWSRSIALGAADTFDVEIQYVNATGAEQEGVTILGWLPEGVELVAGTTRVKNSSNPKSKQVSDNILKPGINIGDYSSGANAYLMYTVKVTDEFEVQCGLGVIGAFASTWHPINSNWSGAAVITQRDC